MTDNEIVEETYSSSSPAEIQLSPRRNDSFPANSNGEETLERSNVSESKPDDLNVYQAAALLTADILGTGLLALPQDIKVLGNPVGLAFLIFNLPINWFAGLILSNAATIVEQHGSSDSIQARIQEAAGDGLVRDRVIPRKQHNKSAYSSVHASDDVAEPASLPEVAKEEEGQESAEQVEVITNEAHQSFETFEEEDNNTHDFIGMSQALFQHYSATLLVMAVFYANIFLVLGDYILVMSHAVTAVVGEERICLPEAGILASTLMFAFCQLRTMANLGRSITILSLTSLAIVVVQCLVAGERQTEQLSVTEDTSFLRKLSALASISFATGSNKLLLNIRCEMKHRDESPRCLAMSQAAFGTVYVMISVLAGPSKFRGFQCPCSSSCFDHLTCAFVSTKIPLPSCLIPFRPAQPAESPVYCCGSTSPCHTPSTRKLFARPWTCDSSTAGYHGIRKNDGYF